MTFESLKKSKLFAGIEEKEISSLLTCLKAKTVHVKKGESIIRLGDTIEYVGVVLEGILDVVKEDADGERSLMARLSEGDHFAEAFCCAGIAKSPVSVTAETDSTILLLDFKKILHTCTSACLFHAKLIENILYIVATKNIYLQTRIEYLSKKTIRKRILKYLTKMSGGLNKTFTIPFNREELADYLCVDRSALSRELMKLKEEKVLDYWKNQFKLY